MPVDIVTKFFLTVSLICTIALTHATKAGFMIKDLRCLTADDFSACPLVCFTQIPFATRRLGGKVSSFKQNGQVFFFGGGIVLACWKLRMIGFEFWSSINTVQMPKRVTWAIRPNHDHLQFLSIKLLELLQQWMKHLILGHIGRSSWLAIGHLKWCKWSF